MNKQELLKQADYTFQRGNRALAKKYLLELLTDHPNDEPGWMLLARVYEEKERKIECYERVLKINPDNKEAKIGLIRVKSVSPTLPKHSYKAETNPFRNILRGTMIVITIILGLGTTTYAIARSNPDSAVAQLIIPATPTLFVETLPDNIAAKTRAEVSIKYPQYSPLLDALIGLAMKSAENGMEGAPERPGAEIVPSDETGEEARSKLEKALPQPGSLTSLTLSEQQLTSWLALEMKNSPDLPVNNIQVYLRDNKIQVWGMVTGSTNSTSALVIGKLGIDTNSSLNVEIESIQIGPQKIPNLLVSQGQAWLNQLISDQINKQVPGLQIMNINISSGLITIAGMR
jgi:hypothetical protein